MTRSDVSYQDKLNELRLDISHPNSQGINFVFVEGKSDIRLFRKLFDIEKCKVESIPGGNPKLEECVNTLIPSYPLILGIRDADFMRLESDSYNHESIFLTDFHDIEMTILSTERVLNALISEYSSTPKTKHFELRDQIIESISLVSCLKWLNHKENLKLKFKPSFLNLISFINFELDINEYVSRVLSKSPNTSINNKNILIQKIIELKELNPDYFQLTNGHDLMNTFAEYFRVVEGRKNVSGEILESSLRIAYDLESFKETTLYDNLKEWEIRNETIVF